MGQSARDRILVVESDPMISDLIARQALQASGYQVQVVTDANAAITRAIQFSPDVIFLDLNLPGLSGKDLMVALSSQGVQIPIIVVARKGSEEDLVQAFRLGAADYLLWPVRESEVIAVVERALKQVHERRERERLSQQLQQANQELQLRVRELTTIFSIGKAVTSITDQNLLFERILEGASKATQADMAWFLLKDEARKAFVLVSQRNLPISLAERVGQVWDDGISSLVAMSGEPLAIFGESLNRFKIVSLGQSALIMPIKVQKQTVGLLTMMRRKPAAFSPSEQHLLEALADYASISLANAMLFRALEERARSLQLSVESAQTSDKIHNEITTLAKQELRPAVDQARGALDKLTQDPAARWTSDQRPALIGLQESLNQINRVVTAFSPLPAEPGVSTVELGNLLRQAIEHAQPFAQQNQVTITFDAGVQHFQTAVDALQIGQVMEGLLSNAIKASPPSGHVQVRLERSPEGMALVSVSDSGTGIEARLAGHIFEGKTASAKSEQSARFAGIGIRLPLIKEIITRHRGKIWVESKSGQGASFYFTLPVVR